jgi:thiosulfate/3-mercaptopyruvate sulfurtransferase
MRHVLSILALSIVLLARADAQTATPRDRLLVTPSWLAAHLKDANLVLLHVGDAADYEQRHIPGARHVSTRDLSAPGAPGTLTLEMPTADVLRSQLSALGISDGSRIVVYYGKDWISPATRVIFTLEYAGLDAVSLLDGGMDAWIRAGHEVTSITPAIRAGELSPLKIRPLVVDADFVKAHSDMRGFALVDARDAAFYTGAQEGGPRDHRARGHITGARSVPFGSIANDPLELKSSVELAALFRNAGVAPGDTIIGYCHIGQQATAMLFAAQTIGHPVLLYDGSFEDWARRGYDVEK